MLDDGPLLAPSCCHLPPTLDPVKLCDWVYHLEYRLLDEIFQLSAQSVMYEMAQHCLRRPWHQQPAADPDARLVALMRFFAETLCPVEHRRLLGKCQLLFLNHLEAGLRTIRFHPALERLLPADPGQPDSCTPADGGGVGTCPISCGRVPHCVAEEVDDERWVFRDEDAGAGVAPRPTPGWPEGRRLVLGANAKLAYSVTLFVWAAVRLHTRRMELLQEFPPDHPLFTAKQPPKVRCLGDSFSALVARRTQVVEGAVELFRQQDWQAAAHEFSRAIAMPPDEGKCFLFKFRATCHLHLRQFEKVIEDCDLALRRNPPSYNPLYLRAKANLALGRPEAARTDVNELLRHYPGSHDVQVLNTQLQSAICNPEDADGSEVGEGASPTSATPPKTFLPIAGCSSAPLLSASAISFANSRLSIHLASLPPYEEPPDIDDPPYLIPFMEGRAELKYKICPCKELGRGASSCVFKAVHPTAGWFMAVKEFEAKHMDGDKELLSALELMATMKHNNIVRCLGLRRLPGFYHMVMEFCSGGSLRSLIAELRGLSLPLMQKYATEVLLGLRYTHGHGLLHRDIKARNILLSHDGSAKIADFGTCMKIPQSNQPRCESVKGTVLWMAPEMFRGLYSPVSDIWSFGCTLIEMATAKDPWHEQQFKEQLTAMVFIATRPEALPGIPPLLAEDVGRHFFHCCIARDPSERCSADLLLRHPWLSLPEPATPDCPASPVGPTGLQGQCAKELFDAATGFPWTTSSSFPESSFISSTASSALATEA